jgi:hypothetical protein
MKMSVKPRKGFDQVVVWPGTTVPEGDEAEFEAFIREEFGLDAQYLEQIKTKKNFAGPGGRIDLFFAIDSSSGNMGSFSIKRLSYGMRWVEDVLAPGNYDREDPLYDDDVFDYIRWKA